MSNTEYTREVYCRCCLRSTMHTIRASHREEGYAEGPGIQWEVDYEIASCNGCGNVSFREEISSSEDQNYIDEYGRYVRSPTVNIYPNPEKGFRVQDMRLKLPNPIDEIYHEVMSAFNHNLYILCAAGLRALIESMCDHLGITGGNVVTKKGSSEKSNFQTNIFGKINGLGEKGFLTQLHVDHLHDLRFIGNKALHEIRCPEKDELNMAFDIIDQTLLNIFYIPKLGSKLGNKLKQEKKK